MAKRKGLPEDALDGLIGGGATRRKPTKKAPKEEPEHKSRFTTHIRKDVAEKARDVAYWERASLSAVVTEALEEYIAKREKKRGEPYPAREGQLKTGRPVS